MALKKHWLERTWMFQVSVMKCARSLSHLLVNLIGYLMTCTTPNCTAITMTLLNRHHEAVPQNVCLCCWLTLLGICFMHVPVWDSRAVSSLAAGPGTVESSARGCFYTIIHLSQAQHTKGHRRMSNKNITTEHELHAQKDQERDDSNAKLNSYVCIICVMWPTRQSALCLWPKEDRKRV